MRHSFFKVVFIFLFTISLSVQAQEKIAIFRDSLDNAFDISHFLYDLHGVLPIISPITEPAVGYGAAGALVYFIPKKKKNVKQFQMPDIVAAFGGYTQNQTWFGGVGYFGFWNQDKIRYRGIAGYGDIKLTFYGTGETPMIRPIDFNLNLAILVQQAIFKIKDSHFYIGGKYLFVQTKVLAFEEIDIPGVNPLDKDLTSSGLGFIAEFENYNNILSPSKGVRLHLDYNQNLELIGSDRNFGRLTFFSYAYLPVNEKWVPAFRIDSQLATGDNPFYALPFVSLRGVPAMRYQGQLTLLAETEQSYNISQRWSLIGFAGMGTAFNNLEDLQAGDLAWNAGAGFRYLIARMLGLKMGLDIARGPETTAFYIVFGSSWMR